MEMPEVKYSSNKVKIGNWYEAICLEEDEIKEFLKKRSQNQLITQKTRILMKNFYKEVELSTYSPTIQYGMAIQLVASRMKICNSKAFDNIQPSLSIVINEKMIHKTQNISDKCELTIAPCVNPCARNSFVIESSDKFDPSDRTLLYNEDFKIRCLSAEEQPLYVFSAPKSANLNSLIANSFDTYNNRGERSLSVGLILDKNTGQGQLIPKGYTKWKCLHIDPSKRFETEGTRVPSNTPLVIVHSATNRNLAAENIMISTLFGPECLVSVQTHLNTHHKEEWQNIWTLTLGKVQKKLKNS